MHVFRSFEHLSQFSCLVFLTQRSFCEWQRSQAERIAPLGLFDMDTATAEPEGTAEVVGTSIDHWIPMSNVEFM